MGKKAFSGFRAKKRNGRKRMRIAPISHYGVNAAQTESRENAKVTNPLRRDEMRSSINPNEVFKAFYGREMISFGARRFGETLKDNYFRLPEGCKPDKFQIQAGKALNEGKNVLVEAPTGTGKTAIAHYAVSKNMEEGKRTFYTTPLKALSNQKLNEFREVYGEENVGILTGDRRENADAPVIIMTTEVYRNMALSDMYGEKTLIDDNLGTVIFDEFHYLGDASRGPVWEESVMFTPRNVQTLALSATIGNPQELNGWMGKLSGDNSELVSVPSEARHVPLMHDKFYTGAYNQEKKIEQREGSRSGTITDEGEVRKSPKPSLKDYRNTVSRLNKKDRLPAIIFVFSKKFSRDLLDYMAEDGDDLTSKKEKEQIDAIVAKHKQNDYVGSDLDLFALRKGYAIHNAGIMPSQKALVEELFQKKLVKAVIATETLAAGINMPAKTVVISSPYKPADKPETDSGIRMLSSNEFMQMSGRAGRRGIDEVGYVYTMPTNVQTEHDFARLEKSKSNPLCSSYEPDYAFLAGYYQYNRDAGALDEIYGKSFRVNSGDEAEQSEKLQSLKELSDSKTDIMKELGFLEEVDGKTVLTGKGYLASKVRGYNTLALTQIIADKQLANITPEALVMFAAQTANPEGGHDTDALYSSVTEEIFSDLSSDVENVYMSMKSSVEKTLKELGKKPEDFESYEEILEFADSLEMPEESEDELRTKISELSTTLNKRKKMSTTKEKYTSAELVTALTNGAVIPTSVLQESYKKVEEYKKRIKEKDISSQIERLEYDYQSIPEGKGKKGKDKNDKIRAKISEDLQYAKRMDFLDKHLPDALSENHKFIKENDFDAIRLEHKHFSEALARLTARETLEKDVRGLQSIEEYTANNDIDKNNAENAKKLAGLTDTMQRNMSEVYNCERKHGLDGDIPRIGTEPALNVYNWARLNSVNTNSLANWMETARRARVNETDEGSLYRSVMQTADLLSQIGEIARAGIESSASLEDVAYYEELANTALQGRKLLICEPVKL